MKRRWIILGIVVVAIIAVIVLIQLGVIDTEWQFLAILAAPFVAIFKSIGNLLKGSDEEEELIREVYNQRRAEEQAHHDQVSTTMTELNQRVETLMSRSTDIEDRIAEIDREREAVGDRG